MTKRERVAAALADAEAASRRRYAEQLGFLDRLFADKSLSPLDEHHARREAEQSFDLNLLRTKLAILAGRYADDGCVPVDLVDAARETTHWQPAAGEAVDE